MSEDYRNYPVRIEFDSQDQLFYAEFVDLPRCSAPGTTVQEAYDRLIQSAQGWMEDAKEQGLPTLRSVIRANVDQWLQLTDGERSEYADDSTVEIPRPKLEDR